MVAVLLAALAGSLVGFLRHNFHPASIYLGDAGSLFVGLMLGALAMIGKYTTANPVALLAPVFVLGVPIFDTLFVMYIRKLRGIPVFLGSPDHFALRLRRWALSVPQVAALSYGVASVLGGIGIAIMFTDAEFALGAVGGTATLGVLAALWLKRIDMSKPVEGTRLAESSSAAAPKTP
jgi:UDP-GlcNAc:undecaprenyl-phosphate GlcNAc-1-phosphate transferase